MKYSELAEKKELIKKYLINNFNLIFSIDEPVFLLGGAIKDIIYNNIVKDLDFVVLSDNTDSIEKLINDNNLQYTKNSFDGYKIKYNNLYIDIWSAQDLYDCIQYNFDGLFYDIKNDSILSFGYINSINDKLIELNNKRNHPSSARKLERLEKITNYILKIIKKG